MTREYAPTRPIRRRSRLTARGRTLLVLAAVAVSITLGLTAELWDPFARVVTP